MSVPHIVDLNPACADVVIARASVLCPSSVNLGYSKTAACIKVVVNYLSSFFFLFQNVSGG